MPTPFHRRPHGGHHTHSDLTFVPGCPECEMALCLLSIEDDLRDLSVDLWIAGWTPTRLVDHICSEVADLRGADLVARGILYEDTTRADHARPSSWCSDIDRLQRASGVDRSELRNGWIIDWVIANSECDRVGDVAGVIEVTLDVLSGLSRPAP